MMLACAYVIPNISMCLYVRTPTKRKLCHISLITRILNGPVGLTVKAPVSWFGSARQETMVQFHHWTSHFASFKSAMPLFYFC